MTAQTKYFNRPEVLILRKRRGKGWREWEVLFAGHSIATGLTKLKARRLKRHLDVVAEVVASLLTTTSAAVINELRAAEPWHIDVCVVPKAWASNTTDVQVLDDERCRVESDHHPVLIDLQLPSVT